MPASIEPRTNDAYVIVKCLERGILTDDEARAAMLALYPEVAIAIENRPPAGAPRTQAAL